MCVARRAQQRTAGATHCAPSSALAVPSICTGSAELSGSNFCVDSFSLWVECHVYHSYVMIMIPNVDLSAANIMVTGGEPRLRRRRYVGALIEWPLYALLGHNPPCGGTTDSCSRGEAAQMKAHTTRGGCNEQDWTMRHRVRRCAPRITVRLLSTVRWCLRVYVPFWYLITIFLKSDCVLHNLIFSFKNHKFATDSGAMRSSTRGLRPSDGRGTGGLRRVCSNSSSTDAHASCGVCTVASELSPAPPAKRSKVELPALPPSPPLTQQRAATDEGRSEVRVSQCGSSRCSFRMASPPPSIPPLTHNPLSHPLSLK